MGKGQLAVYQEISRMGGGDWIGVWAWMDRRPNKGKASRIVDLAFMATKLRHRADLRKITYGNVPGTGE